MNHPARLDTQQKRDRFNAVLSGSRCLIAGSVFDPLSARIAEDVGFEVGVMGGSAAALAVLGAPDIMLVTLSELAEQTRRICRASDICVLVDADHGYGNALNVMRTVDDLVNAGACGLSIEDTLLPRAFGSASKPELISLEEAVGKMRAAVEAARGTGLAVFGRTTAMLATGIDDAVARLKAYAEAGVQAAFVPYLKTRAQLDRISAELSLPIILGNPAAELVDMDYLASRRVRVCLRGHQGLPAGVQAMYEVAQAMFAGQGPDTLTGLAPEALMARLSRADVYERNTGLYLKP